MPGKTRSTASKATAQKQSNKPPVVALRRSARLNKPKEGDKPKEETCAVDNEIDQRKSEVALKVSKKSKKKFVRIDKIDFRCRLKGCCQDQPIAFRSLLLGQNVGVVLNDDNEEALVIPELSCHDSGASHRSWEVLKGSHVQRRIGSDEVRTSPKNPLFLDIDRLNRFDNQNALSLSAWTRRKNPYEGFEDENEQDKEYGSDSSLVS